MLIKLQYLCCREDTAPDLHVIDHPVEIFVVVAFATLPDHQVIRSHYHVPCVGERGALNAIMVEMKTRAVVHHGCK